MSGVPDPLVRSALEEVLRIAPGKGPLRVGALSQLACIPPYALDMEKSRELSGQALALAREHGDKASLFQALRARLHSLSGPDDADELLAATDEMLELDRSAPSWMRGEANIARVGVFLYRGELNAASAALRECGRVASELRLPEMIWFHDRIRAQWLFIEGDFTGAEAATTELRARSARMGLSYGAAFIDMLRFTLALARSGTEALGGGNMNTATAFADGSRVQASYRASMVRFAADSGQLAAAQRMLDTMAARNFEDVPRDIGYLNALYHLGLAAAIVGDRVRAGRLYELLAPYPQHNTPNNMMMYEGSVSYPLARLAALLEDGRAQRHFEDALAMNERMGMQPALARVSYAYAEWLKNQPGRDAPRCAELAARARAIAERLGMRWLAERAARL
jgi:hypothetical protein